MSELGRILRYPMAKIRKRNPIHEDDPREVPLYTVAEAAFAVGVAPTTVQKWVHGRDYKHKGEIRQTPPVIEAANTDRGLLSFANLAEIHVLDAIREQHFSMQAIREAIDAITQRYPENQKHPLITGEFYRSGKELFLKVLSETISVSRPRQGQPVLGDLLDRYLERIVRDEKELPFRLFPMRANPDKRIMVDLYIASGQPVIRDTGILADFIYERNKTGESIAEIAEDYGLDARAVADAIRYVSAA